MVEYLIQRLHDPKFVASILAAIAAMATVITLAMPLLSGDQLNRRLKSVAIEREKMRQRERERLARGEKVQLRQTPKQYMKDVVDRFKTDRSEARGRSWALASMQSPPRQSYPPTTRCHSAARFTFSATVRP